VILNLGFFLGHKSVMKKKRYTYFVSYSHSTGFGCIELFRDSLIDNFNSIKQLCENDIPKSNGLEKVVVLNYQLLKTEDVKS